MSSQSQITERAPSDRAAASEPLMSVLKLAATTEPAVAGPAPKSMMSQPASLCGSESMPQMLIRLTGTYSPVTPPASWRRARRTSDAA